MRAAENESPRQEPDSRLGRRTVVKTAAWSVPVIAVAVAAPSASASPAAAYDGQPAGLQMGYGFTVFNTALTERYTISGPVGFTYLNNGTAPVPAGSSFILTYDNRIFSPKDFSYGNGTVDGPLVIGTPVVTGNSSQLTVILPVEVPPNSDIFSSTAVRIFTNFDQTVVYPNDVFDTMVGTQFLLAINDSDTSNNLMGPDGLGTPVPASPWGVVAGRVWTPYSWNGGTCHVELAGSGTFTSVGPNPTYATDQVMVNYDARIVTAAAPTTVTLNGVAAPGLLTVTQDVPSGNRGTTYFNLTQPLQTGDVLKFGISYTYAPDPGSITNIESSGLQWWPVDHLNDPNQRTTEAGTGMYNSTGYCSV